jgi:hypothetical protein
MVMVEKAGEERRAASQVRHCVEMALEGGHVATVVRRAAVVTFLAAPHDASETRAALPPHVAHASPRDDA